MIKECRGYKVGDIVYPLLGPHRGERARIVAIHKLKNSPYVKVVLDDPDDCEDEGILFLSQITKEYKGK